MLLTLALAHEDLNQSGEAIKAARNVIDLVHQHSDEAYEAKAVIARLSLSGANLKTELVTLESDARNREQTHAANNIALTLAKESTSVEETLKWLDKVIFTARDPYNLTRAIVEKMTAVGAHVGTYQLRDRDRQLLNAAYSYSYSQRIGNLLVDATPFYGNCTRAIACGPQCSAYSAFPLLSGVSWEKTKGSGILARVKLPRRDFYQKTSRGNPQHGDRLSGIAAQRPSTATWRTISRRQVKEANLA